jgi:hypothetical protein
MHCFVVQPLKGPPLYKAARLKLSRKGPLCNFFGLIHLMDTSSACSMDGIVQEPVYSTHAEIHRIHDLGLRMADWIGNVPKQMCSRLIIFSWVRK